MSGQTIILSTPNQRSIAKRLIHMAPQGSVLTVRDATRSGKQNAKMWAMLSDVSRAKPEGRTWTTDVWKAAFMHFLGHEVQWQQGLDGQTPFPASYRTSRLSKERMADLITVISEYGDRHGVVWSDKVDS